jgi:hypothetical protein
MTHFNKIIKPETVWGELYEPAVPKKNSGEGLRVVLFISCNCGDITLKNLFRFEQKYPDKLNIVGVATDDPVDPNARITLRKRVWSAYTPEERSELKDKLINTCMDAGIPCYTGAVKTDYFRSMFKTWDPEALIMFCFGQWLDPFLFEYPVMGSYNLHPSDLPKHIGAGTQPFQNAMKNGLKTAPLVIHQITGLIDMGPIVGVSAPVNITLADGTYPSSLLTLLEKITSPGGWMCVQLISEIFEKRSAGLTGPIERIDFEKELPADIKILLAKPATNDLTEMYTVPEHPLLK